MVITGMPVDYSVIQVDRSGYRVAGTIDIIDDKGAAQAILEIARGAVGLARTMNKPLATITLSWKGGVAVVKVKNGEVVAILLEESKEGPPTYIGKAKALA